MSQEHTPTNEEEFEKSLIEMSVTEAQKAKWDAGRKLYGEEFVGEPVVCLHSEGIDSLNYIDELERRNGRRDVLDKLRDHAEGLVRYARLLYYL